MHDFFHIIGFRGRIEKALAVANRSRVMGRPGRDRSKVD